MESIIPGILHYAEWYLTDEDPAWGGRWMPMLRAGPRITAFAQRRDHLRALRWRLGSGAQVSRGMTRHFNTGLVVQKWYVTYGFTHLNVINNMVIPGNNMV